MAGSTGRETVSLSRGLMMLRDVCYDQVFAANLVDSRHIVSHHP